MRHSPPVLASINNQSLDMEEHMKVLIAARGNSLDSRLASDLENAEWYLVVDTGRHEIDALKACGQPAQALLHGALAEGITVLLTGSKEQHTPGSIPGGITTVSFHDAMTVGQALEAWAGPGSEKGW